MYFKFTIIVLISNLKYTAVSVSIFVGLCKGPFAIDYLATIYSLCELDTVLYPSVKFFFTKGLQNCLLDLGYCEDL